MAREPKVAMYVRVTKGTKQIIAAASGAMDKSMGDIIEDAMRQYIKENLSTFNQTFSNYASGEQKKKSK